MSLHFTTSFPCFQKQCTQTDPRCTVHMAEALESALDLGKTITHADVVVNKDTISQAREVKKYLGPVLEDAQAFIKSSAYNSENSSDVQFSKTVEKVAEKAPEILKTVNQKFPEKSCNPSTVLIGTGVVGGIAATEYLGTTSLLSSATNVLGNLFNATFNATNATAILNETVQISANLSAPSLTAAAGISTATLVAGGVGVAALTLGGLYYLYKRSSTTSVAKSETPVKSSPAVTRPDLKSALLNSELFRSRR